MSLVPSLLQAIVRVDGEALIMHVGDKPSVVSPIGQVDLATRGLTLDAVRGLCVSTAGATRVLAACGPRVPAAWGTRAPDARGICAHNAATLAVRAAAAGDGAAAGAFAGAESPRGRLPVLLRKPGGGRLAAREVLIDTPAVRSILAEGKTSQLPLAIEGGRAHGMVPLNDWLVGYVQGGAVDVREAYRRAVDRAGFLALLKRQGLDASAIERFA